MVSAGATCALCTVARDTGEGLRRDHLFFFMLCTGRVILCAQLAVLHPRPPGGDLTKKVVADDSCTLGVAWSPWLFIQ